jgi:hypothetical protein
MTANCKRKVHRKPKPATTPDFRAFSGFRREARRATQLDCCSTLFRMPDRGDPPRPRKDRLIQTRVPRDLETTLKEEARRRRLTVSHLIRSVLEDTFHLVDGVVADVDEIVGNSARLARNVRRNARRLVSPRPRAETPDRDAPHDLSHVAAWNEVVANRTIPCVSCSAEIPRGARGFVGLSDEPHAERVWLCSRCVEDL